MTRTYTPVTSYANAVATDAPRTIGALLSPADSHALKLSFQILSPYSDPNGAAWDDTLWAWDAALWNDYGAWVDYTDLVRGLHWTRGADTPGGPPRTGSASVTLANRDGIASPWADTGEFAPSGETYLRPGIFVRFGTTDSGSTYYPWFTGLIDSIDEGTQDGADGWVTLNVVDVTALYAAISRPALSSAGTTDTGPDTRFTRIRDDIIARLGVVDIPDFDFATDPSWLASAMRPTTLGGNAMDELALTAASVYGRVFATSRGLIALTGQGSGLPLAFIAGSGILAGFLSNSPTAGVDYPIAVDGVHTYSSKERLLNDITAAETGGAGHTASDPASIALYGDISQAFGFPRTDLICDHATVVLIVEAELGARANDFVGIASIDLDADMSADLWWAMNIIATRGLEYRVKLPDVKWIHPSGKQLFIGVLLDAFTMDLTMQGSQAKWIASIQTSKGEA